MQVDFSLKSGIPGAKETILIGDLCRSGVAKKCTLGTLHHILGYVLGALVGDAEVDVGVEVLREWMLVLDVATVDQRTMI